MGHFGRKRLPPSQRRSTTIGIRFTLVERLTLQMKAQAAGCTVTRLIRTAALDLELQPPVVVPAINREAWLELARLAASLKGSLWRTNSDERLASELRNMSRKLDEVRAQLRGDSCNDEDADEAGTSPIN